MSPASSDSANISPAATGEGLTPAQRLAAHIKFDLDIFVCFCPLTLHFGPFTLAEVFETFEPSDFARFLAVHPSEAIKLIIKHVDDHYPAIKHRRSSMGAA